MARSRLALLLLLLAAVAALTLGPAGAVWAHPGLATGFGDAQPESRPLVPVVEQAPAPALTAAPEPPGWPGPVLVALLAAAALGWRRPRGAAALVLVLALAVLAFEGGLHSVHHGGDPAQAQACAVAAASAHLAGIAVDTDPGPDLALPVVAVVPRCTELAPRSLTLRPDQGRAPPAATA